MLVCPLCLLSPALLSLLQDMNYEDVMLIESTLFSLL